MADLLEIVLEHIDCFFLLLRIPLEIRGEITTGNIKKKDVLIILLPANSHMPGGLWEDGGGVVVEGAYAHSPHKSSFISFQKYTGFMSFFFL